MSRDNEVPSPDGKTTFVPLVTTSSAIPTDEGEDDDTTDEKESIGRASSAKA